MANQTYRVLELIRRFNNNEIVCISQLQNEPMWSSFKDRKTIERDLAIIKKVFPDTFHLVKGGAPSCYKAVTNELFSNITSAENMSLLVQTFNIADRSTLFSDLNIDASDKRILEKKIKESKNTYLFKNKPYENRSGDVTLFKQLEQAIYHRKEIIIEYKAISRVEQAKLKPYKIVFINENFYIACEGNHPMYQFSLFRISKIEALEVTGKNFHQNRDMANFIKDMQTPFAKYTSNYKEHLLEVIVEVTPDKAHYFKTKKYLPSQKIVEEKKDGTLTLSFTVTHELEMMDLVKRWIPHLIVISPISLKKNINNDLRKYLESE